MEVPARLVTLSRVEVVATMEEEARVEITSEAHGRGVATTASSSLNLCKSDRWSGHAQAKHQ